VNVAIEGVSTRRANGKSKPWRKRMNPGYKFFPQVVREHICDRFVGLEEYLGNAADDGTKTHPVNENLSLSLAL